MYYIIIRLRISDLDLFCTLATSNLTGYLSYLSVGKPEAVVGKACDNVWMPK